MSRVFELKISALEDTNHGLSRSSSSSTNKFRFLEIKSKDCTPTEKEKIEVYRSIVALFGINQGKFRMDKDMVNKNYMETKNLLLDMANDSERENIIIPIVNENEKYTKNHIQNIVSYYRRDSNITIDDVDIDDLEKHVNQAKEENKNNGKLRLGDFEKKLSAHIVKVKLKDDSLNKKNQVSDLLFNIAEDKHFYNNLSWLAMNFYDTIGIKHLDKNGKILENSIETIKSYLITSDMNNSTHYKYFMLKNGMINTDNNISRKYHYFLAEDGVTNPYNEMKATLHYFFDDKSKTNNRICKYNNRFILLKQLFKKYDVDYPELKLNCNELDEDEVRGYQYNYVYVTSGQDNDESYGHTMLHIYKGEKLIVKTKNKKSNTQNPNLIPDVTMANVNKYSKPTVDINKEVNSTTNIKVGTNITNENNNSFVASELYVNFGVPPVEKQNFFEKISYQIKGMIGKIYGKFNIHTSETFLYEDYQNRLVVKVPITILDEDIDKKILLASQINHIEKNQENFKFPYKFISKNCAYILSDILEVPLPKLRKKFNEEGYFSFAPKDVYNLLKGDINVNGHEAKHY